MSAIQSARSERYSAKPVTAPITCSFCGKPREEVRKMFVVGDTLEPAICNECVDLRSDILHGDIWRREADAAEIEYQSWIA